MQSVFRPQLWLGSLINLSAILSIYLNLSLNWDLFKVAKPATTILIIAYAWVFGDKSTPYFRLILAGLFFCLIGDTLLLWEAYFVGGLVAFLIAHMLFYLGFVSEGGMKYKILPLLILLAIGGGYYAVLYEDLGALKIPVMVYVSVIVLMAWQGVSLRIWRKEKAYTLIAIAVILFMLSDSLLAWNKFKQPLPFSALWILSTYWASIFLLAISTSLIRIKH